MRTKLKGAAAASALLSTSLFKPAAALTSLSDMDLSNSYHLSRILFLRLLAVVYIAAFSVARSQNKGLIGGEHGFALEVCLFCYSHRIWFYR
jgi:hypothetical protein